MKIVKKVKIVKEVKILKLYVKEVIAFGVLRVAMFLSRRTKTMLITRTTWCGLWNGREAGSEKV